MNRRFSPFLIAILLIPAGCNWNQGPEELARLLKEDVDFRQMIGQRDQAHGQINLIKNDLLKKKQAVDAQVQKLRSEYDLLAKAQNQKIEQLRGTIESNRSRLKKGMESADAEVETKQAELEGYQKTLVDVQKVLRESKGITLSSQEKKKWEERILMLNEKIRPLAEEIQDIKLQTRLKKQKIGYLN